MSNNDYDNYEYESNSSSSSVLRKRLFIGLLIVVGIILLIIFFNNWKRNPSTSKFDYESDLLTKGKQYYDSNNHKMPKVAGECSLVTLETLSSLKLVETDKYKKCTTDNTYVQVCKLESGAYQWAPWLTCSDFSSESVYGKFKEGTEASLVKDVSHVKFEFMLEEIDSEENLGEEEELWKDEITYKDYKTISTTNFYRHKDIEYIWNIKVKEYYSRDGKKTSASGVKDYYTDSPSSGYNSKDSGATAYKWYTSEGTTKEYYLGSNGEKAFSQTEPAGYPNKDESSEVVYTKYRSRTIIGTYAPYLYYKCAVNSTSTTFRYQKAYCGTETTTPNTPYLAKKVYACKTYDDSTSQLIETNQNTLCIKYSDWSLITDTKCGNDSEVCQSATVKLYNWYKGVDNQTKKYYPSGSSNASDEKAYYTSAPVKGAMKDESTGTKAYKWYKTTPGLTTSYYSESPESGATKTNTSRWSDWSDWSATEPEVKSEQERKIESRVKLKIRQIKSTENAKYNNLTSQYVSESDIIKKVRELGKDVNTLSDVSSIGQLKYKLKMYVRNKEAK